MYNSVRAEEDHGNHEDFFQVCNQVEVIKNDVLAHRFEPDTHSSKRRKIRVTFYHYVKLGGDINNVRVGLQISQSQCQGFMEQCSLESKVDPAPLTDIDFVEQEQLLKLFYYQQFPRGAEIKYEYVRSEVYLSVGGS